MPSPSRQKTCEECGGRWPTRKPDARTCSPKCRAQLREREHPTRGAAARDYDPMIVEQVRWLYTSGMTVAEVQRAVSPGVKVQNVITRYDITMRPAIPRDQRGPRNARWRGDAAGYQAMHMRVESARGKPSRCERCGMADQTRTRAYHWANLTGHYEDISDYERMCVSCHLNFDAARRALTGKRTSLLRHGQEVMPHV